MQVLPTDMQEIMRLARLGMSVEAMPPDTAIWKRKLYSHRDEFTWDVYKSGISLLGGDDPIAENELLQVALEAAFKEE